MDNLWQHQLTEFWFSCFLTSTTITLRAHALTSLRARRLVYPSLSTCSESDSPISYKVGPECALFITLASFEVCGPQRKCERYFSRILVDYILRLYLLPFKMLDNELNHNGDVQLMNKPSSAIAHPFSEMCSSASLVVPETPKDGVVVKVGYVGACYSEGQMRRKRIRPRFPGVEVAGHIHDVSNSLPNSNFTIGDRVILFPNEDLADSGYAEFLAIDDTRQVMQIPQTVPLEVAAMLPGGALSAYAAVLAAKPHVEKLQQVKSCVNVLVVGGGGLGLWTIRLAQLLMGSLCNSIKLFVADNSIDKLLTAQDHGCYDIVHWNEEDHEQYIVERTLDACRGGVDVIIDYVSSPRTMQRSLKVLNREGLILVGGNSMSEVSISLNALAAKQQSIVGIPKGNMNQLRDLVTFVSEGKLSPPCYAVFPIEDVNQVFDDLCECRITGRAIFKLASSATVTDNQ